MDDARTSLNASVVSPYRDTDAASMRSATPSIFHTGGSDALGVSYFDAAMGLMKTSTSQQFKSTETWRAVFSELFGSFVLLFVTGGAVSAIGHDEWNVNSQGIYLMAITYAFVLFGLCSGLCPLGFAFFNPTTTISTAIAGQLSLTRAILFLVVQVLGAISGGIAASGVHTTPLTAYCVDTVIDVESGGMILIEVVSAITVGFVSVCVYNDRKNANNRWPLVYSSLSFGIIIACAKSSGSAANPAWSLSFAVVSQCMDAQWAVWTGGIVGGVIAGIFFRIHQMMRDSTSASFAGSNRSRTTSIASITSYS